MTNFLIGRAYRDYLSAMGFCVEQVLKKAGLPEDLFARQAPCLGAEEYFVMGDNRPCSHDSRRIGPIPRRAIRARVCCVFWPPRRCRRIRRGNVISSRRT